MSTIQERLNELFPPPLERGLMARIADLCDVSRPTVSAWFNTPEKVATISRANAEKICAKFHPDISPAWLAEGIGQKNVPVGTVHVVAQHSNIEPCPDLRGQVPLVSWVRAGGFCEALTPLDPNEVERWLDCPVRHSAETFALRVRGDSMTATTGTGRSYPEGCIIFVDPERRNPVNGDRIVACLLDEHQVTFKVYKTKMAANG